MENAPPELEVAMEMYLVSPEASFFVSAGAASADWAAPLLAAGAGADDPEEPEQPVTAVMAKHTAAAKPAALFTLFFIFTILHKIVLKIYW